MGYLHILNNRDLLYTLENQNAIQNFFEIQVPATVNFNEIYCPGCSRFFIFAASWFFLPSIRTHVLTGSRHKCLLLLSGYFEIHAGPPQAFSYLPADSINFLFFSMFVFLEVLGASQEPKNRARFSLLNGHNIRKHGKCEILISKKSTSC